MHPIIEGLMILAKYYPNEQFSANRDRLSYVLYEPHRIKEDDLTKLAEIGWREDDGYWTCDLVHAKISRKPHTQRVVEGLNILYKYYLNGEVKAIHHKVYYRPNEPDKISEADSQILAELGWQRDYDNWEIEVG